MKHSLRGKRSGGTEAPVFLAWRDDGERDRLVLEQLPLVRYIARRIHGNVPRCVPLEDLVQAGIIGLIDALYSYDPHRQVRFGSYARFRVRGAILDSLREIDWGPRRLRYQARRLEEVRSRFTSSFGRYPTQPETAEHMGMSLHDLQLLLGQIHGLQLESLQRSLSGDGNQEGLLKCVGGGQPATPFFHCLRSETMKLVACAIGELPEQQQKVIWLYYQRELTMSQIGRALGLSASRVSQIRSTAIMHLRANMIGKE